MGKINEKIKKYLVEDEDEIIDFIKETLSSYGFDDEDSFDDVLDYYHKIKNETSNKKIKSKIEDYISDMR